MTPPLDMATPCLLVDLDALESNLRRMQGMADAAGKRLRPHAKTHKCSALAKQQVEHGAYGMCAATVAEAEGLVRAGIRNVLLTSPVVQADKARRLVGLLERDPQLMVVVDSREGLAALAGALAKAGRTMGVLLDIDLGLHRTGVQPAEAMDMAAAMEACPQVELRGIQAYAGHLQHVADFEARASQSRLAIGAAARTFRELRDRFPSCTIMSTSGTGTFQTDLAVPEITEIQPGSYVFMDGEYRAIGSAGNPNRFLDFAPSLRVLSTVVSARHDGFVTIDAGLKALYRDGGVPEVFGDAADHRHYDWFGDEFGRITHDTPGSRPEVGSQLELIPAHCDPTVNLYNAYLLRRGETIIDTWAIDLKREYA